MALLATTARMPGLGPHHGASVQPLDFVLLYLALYIVALGTGGIKPNVSSFGADQFDETDPEELEEKRSFFNWFYFSVNLGGIIAMTVIVWIQVCFVTFTPRSCVTCFTELSRLSTVFVLPCHNMCGWRMGFSGLFRACCTCSFVALPCLSALRSFPTQLLQEKHDYSSCQTAKPKMLERCTTVRELLAPLGTTMCFQPWPGLST